MRILLIGGFSQGSLELSYFNAFKKFDFEVNQFNWMSASLAIPLANNRYTRRLFESYLFSVANKKFLENVFVYKPDLILVFKGEFIFPQTLKRIKESSKTLLFNFNPDNPFNFNKGASNDLIRKSIPFYDCYFIWGRFLVDKLKSSGAKRVEYLPFACDPELHYPVKIINEEKKDYENDVAFIGSWDKEREEWLENLSNYDLAIWGNAWEKLKWNSSLKKKWKGRAAIGSDFAKVCSSSKIILNLIRKQNGNAHNMRIFEIPACKGFMLTKRTKEQCEFFEEDKEMVCFDSLNELKEKIDKYLLMEEERLQISLAANKRVQTYTYLIRAKKIRDLYNELICS